MGAKVSGPTAVLLAGNSSANLSCGAESGAVQTVAWRKGGAPLAPGDRLVFAKDMRSLMISPLLKDDNGEFTCELSNQVSRAAASYKMVVNCEYAAR